MRPLLLASALTLAARFAWAQGFDKPPKRPDLAAGADTNNALAYYGDGMRNLRDDPDRAAASFYWASRLDPNWAAPLYGEHAALLLAMPHDFLTSYLDGRRRSHGERFDRIDSLARLALLRNPFPDNTFDGVLISTWLDRETGNEDMLRELGRVDRRFTAWSAYLRGDLRMALRVFAEQIRNYPDDPDLRVWRARAFFQAGQQDSARVMIEQNLKMQRGIEDTLPGVGWVSHAFDEFSIGFLYRLAKQPDSARAAYERALAEDDAFHAAHHQLGLLRLAAHDTAAALQEFALAVNLAPGEPVYLFDLGTLQVVAGKVRDGLKTLQQAVDADPVFAVPHYTMGIIYAESGFNDEAIAQFTAFIALAPQVMGPSITAARKQIAALKQSP